MRAFTLAKLLYQNFVQKDEESGVYILRKIADLLLDDYRFLYPQTGWWKNEPFNAYLRRFNEHKAMNSDRHWMVSELCRLTTHVPGDTAECGVFQGATSYLICLSNRGTDKRHHIFDSFEGLSNPGPRDGNYWRPGVLACGLDEVKKNLADFPAVDYHQGWIPDRFPAVADKRFSFVHVDVDLEQPTIDSVAFFYPLLSPGGILVCDDYGFTTCPGATKAIDEFFSDKPEKMLALSAGGGFVIKGIETGPKFEEIAGKAASR
ncbi:MAG: TylF/MycF/NovP-related O-methyltransferase [Byssovorax sp.]